MRGIATRLRVGLGDDVGVGLGAEVARGAAPKFMTQNRRPVESVAMATEAVV